MSLITVRPTSKANRLLWNLTVFRDPEPQDLVFSLQTYYIVRAHRSHRWGRWFESNCHHHSEALVDQGLLLLCLHPGVHCPRVVFVGVNGSDNPNCQNCRLAQLPELSGWLHWWKGAAFVSLTSGISCQQVSSQTVSYLRLISMMISSSYASPV